MSSIIEDIRKQALKDSVVWFPEVHDTDEQFLVHSALGLAGETGEAVDVIKKWHRSANLDVDDLDIEALGAELADVFIYLLHICSATGIDLEAEYLKKSAINAARFSPKRSGYAHGFHLGDRVSFVDGGREHEGTICSLDPNGKRADIDVTCGCEGFLGDVPIKNLTRI